MVVTPPETLLPEVDLLGLSITLLHSPSSSSSVTFCSPSEGAVTSLLTLLDQLRGLGLGSGGLLKGLLGEGGSPEDDSTFHIEGVRMWEKEEEKTDKKNTDINNGMTRDKAKMFLVKDENKKGDACDRNEIKNSSAKVTEENKFDGAFEVEHILGRRELEGQVEFLIKWVGFPGEQDNTWEPKKNLRCEQKILQFLESQVEAKMAISNGSLKNESFEQLDLSLEKSTNCSICSTDLVPVYKSDKHNRRFHKVSSLDVIPCEHCDEWFLSTDNLEEHVGFHDINKDPEKLFCDQCRFFCRPKLISRGKVRGPNAIKAKGNRVMIEHLECHKQTIQCDQCEKSTTSKRAMTQHVHNTHTSLVKKCSMCDYETRDMSTFKMHFIRNHGGIYDIQCPQCIKKFALNADLKSHIKTCHTEYEPVKCNECNRLFRLKHQLNFHMKKIHRNERNSVCTECGKKFMNVRELTEHQRIHTGEKPFKCDVCHATFTKSSHRTRHMKIHSQLKSHICPFCGKGFIQKNNMTVHQSKCS